MQIIKKKLEKMMKKIILPLVVIQIFLKSRLRPEYLKLNKIILAQGETQEYQFIRKRENLERSKMLRQSKFKKIIKKMAGQDSDKDVRDFAEKTLK